MNGLPSHHPPIPTTSCKEHLPSQAPSRPLPGGWGVGWSACEKLEAGFPAAGARCSPSRLFKHGRRFDVGLTAKFVLRKSVSFSFTSPAGRRARSGGTGGENSDAESRGWRGREGVGEEGDPEAPHRSPPSFLTLSRGIKITPPLLAASCPPLPPWTSG